MQRGNAGVIAPAARIHPSLGQGFYDAGASRICSHAGAWEPEIMSVCDLSEREQNSEKLRPHENTTIKEIS